MSTRENYKKGNVKDFKDGDDEYVTYEYGVHTLISDKSRVVKGGSWADRLYWLSPGTRRFKDEDKASRDIGFRCAMTRVGGPSGNENTAGNTFGVKSKPQRQRY